MIFDGTFLHRPVSIVGIMNAKTNTIIKGMYDVRENSEHQLSSFFMPLKAKGLSPLSCTTDGNPQSIKVIKRVWPNIITQRCVVHIQRQGLMWCRVNPKTSSARKLREIFVKATKIWTKEDRNMFLKSVADWEDKYGQLITHKPEKGKVFSDIKRARSMLLKALPDMFHYINNSDIPSTTNGIEGYFSRLKRNYRGHRGLAKTKRRDYFKWYFFLKPK
ncbi:hypothetical protein FP828_04675 [bacterium]|nr:hypothetical protein [bacterium]